MELAIWQSFLSAGLNVAFQALSGSPVAQHLRLASVRESFHIHFTLQTHEPGADQKPQAILRFSMLMLTLLSREYWDLCLSSVEAGGC